MTPTWQARHGRAKAIPQLSFPPIDQSSPPKPAARSACQFRVSNDFD
jgi:hypothetical protein